MSKANYHTHTTRCHHAVGADETYVLAALDAGFTVLGFSDHTPWPFLSGFVSNIRMSMKDLPGYITSVQSLRAKYADRIEMHMGLEVEYFPRYKDHLLRMRDAGMEYYILGEHYLESEEDHPYVGQSCATDDGVLRYAEAVAEALQTGLFCYVAHPDLYMRPRPVFDKVCEQAADIIAQAAREADVPLEYNLLGLDSQLTGHDRGYPCKDFWSHLAGKGNRAIIGVDAHDPAMLKDTNLWNEATKRLTELHYPIQETLPL